MDLVARHGLYGPLDVYDPDNICLRVSWVGSKGAEISWDRLERKWQVACGPIALAGHLQLLSGMSRSAVATRRVNKGLRLRQLPPVAGVVCYAPMLPAFRPALCSMVLCGSSCWSDVERRRVVSHVRAVSRGMDKQRSKFNAVSACKTITDETLLGHSDDELLRAANGSGMKRVDKVWGCAVAAFQLRRLEEPVPTCRCLHLPEDAVNDAVSLACHGLPSCKSYRKEQQFFSATRQASDDYTRDMRVPRGCVLVPDDKQKKLMWKIPALTYQAVARLDLCHGRVRLMAHSTG